MKKLTFIFIPLFLLLTYSIIDLKPNFSVNYKIKGVDISHWNEVSSWSKLKPNINFVIIKATQGSSYTDPKFNSYWESSKKNNITRGAYHFFQPGISAEKQFSNFKKNVKLSKGDLPPVLDVEDKLADMDEVNKWLELAEKHYGVRPIIYSDYLFFKVFMDGKVKDYKLWLHIDEKYNLQPSFNNHDCNMWQYSHKGKLPGIKGDVDLDYFLDNQSTFKQMLIN
tara:strand:+ start:6450 stop:7121 length:672 start_codon:yes stop_codon:yes gene_type:complete